MTPTASDDHRQPARYLRLVIADELLDRFDARRRAVGELGYLVGDHGEAAARVARARRSMAALSERRLSCPDVVDDADDARHLVGALDAFADALLHGAQVALAVLRATRDLARCRERLVDGAVQPSMTPDSSSSAPMRPRRLSSWSFAFSAMRSDTARDLARRAGDARDRRGLVVRPLGDSSLWRDMLSMASTTLSELSTRKWRMKRSSRRSSWIRCWRAPRLRSNTLRRR